jgi:hypothetical protein
MNELKQEKTDAELKVNAIQQQMDELNHEKTDMH